MIWNPCAYDAAHKRSFHAAARGRLRKLADLLGWPKDSYDLRCNPGGVAVSGEVTLHSEGAYVQVSQSFLGPDCGILVRACRGRRDFTGGMNTFAPLDLLDDLPALADRIRRELVRSRLAA